MNELQIMESKELRNKLAERYEVLDKVKNLILMPDKETASVKQIADYYEVGEEAIQSLYKDNKTELDEDGVFIKKPKDFSNVPGGQLKTQRGFSVLFFEGKEMSLPNRGLKVFSRRAVLRIGMLLRDSKIAKEVRTQLLNIEEKVDTETKLSDINEEQSLALSLGMALASGDLNAITIATGNMMAFKNRHIKKLEVANKALSESILDWEDRDKLNSAVRRFASRINVYFPNVWNDLYKELKYGYHIDVKTRDKKKNEPLISTIKEFEWPTVIKCFCAMCEREELDINDVFSNKI